MPECIQSYNCFKRTALQKFYFLTDTFQDIFERTVSQMNFLLALIMLLPTE